MTARRIVLSTIGTLGDIIPFARLATALHARGHTVTVHAWPQFARWFPAEARFVPAAGELDEVQLHDGFDDALRVPTYVAQTRRFGRMFYGLGEGVARARAAYVQAREAFAGHDFAVINVLDHLAQCAADDLALPWASYASRPPPPLGPGDAAHADLDAELGALLADATGRARRIRMFRERSSVLTLIACSRALLPARLHVAADVDITGAWLAPVDAPAELPVELAAFVARGPCLFATFGTMADIHDRTASLIAAARASGWRAVIQVLPPMVATSPDESIYILRERVAFDALVPRVEAVVHHGSVGTVHEVVRAGKPSFAVAHMGDQPLWAEALAEHALGPSGLRYTAITVAALSARMAALRDPAFARNALALAPRIAAEDGVRYAAERIDAIVTATA